MPILYYSDNNTGDATWENPDNWFLDDACTMQAGRAPWVDADGAAYLAYDLTTSSAGGQPPFLDINSVGMSFGTGATGSVSIDYITNCGVIRGGYWQSLGFTNEYLIHDGTFAGDESSNAGGIYGGTFDWDDFSNYGAITAGTLQGQNFTNYGEIYGGTFLNNPLDGGGFNNQGIVYNGTFYIDGFVNYGEIVGGIFYCANLQNEGGGSISGGEYYPPGTVTLTSAGGVSYRVVDTATSNPGFPTYEALTFIDIPNQSDTDPGVANVRSGTSYQYGGASKTGSLAVIGGGASSASSSTGVFGASSNGGL